MSDLKQALCEQSYENLKQLYKTLRARLDPHLSVLALAELGVDVSMVDLYKETSRGGPYYLPMSQSRLQSLDERPNFVPGFSMDDYQWNHSDAYTLLRAFYDQMTRSGEDSLFRAYEKTKWCPKRQRTSMERMLHENGNGSTTDPTRQFDWSLDGMFEALPLPHQISMSRHFLPNVQGLIRSEMMIIAGVIGTRMKRCRFRDHEIFPLLLLSVIGRDARIIQAHMCPDEQRLKVRCSQLFDFSYYTPAQRDLFIRWLLSEPITERQPTADGEEQPTSPAGETAPQLTTFGATKDQGKTRCSENLLDASMPMSMSMGTTIMVS